MKRELNSRSRRKWVAGGVLAFGSVALLSTGFATWVIGANQTYQQGQVNVTIDTVQSNSFIFEATIANTLQIGEKVAVNEGFVRVESPNASAMQLTLSGLKVTAGADVKAPKDLTFELVSDGSTISNNPTAAGIKYDDKHTTESTYIAAPASVTGLTWTATPLSNGLKEYTVDNQTIEFTFGSFFGNVAPSTFYNTFLTGTAVDEASEIVTATKNVKDEMDAFFNSFTGKILVLKVTVTQVD